MGWTGQNAMRQRRRLKAYLRSRRAAPCMDCGVLYPWYVMEFDHARGTKRNDVAKLAHAPVSMATLLTELAKCDLVCANCHRGRTYRRLGLAG